MFLAVPIWVEYNAGEWVEDEILINPFQVIAVETVDESECRVILINERFYYVRLDRDAFASMVQDYVADNIIASFYNWKGRGS